MPNEHHKRCVSEHSLDYLPLPLHSYADYSEHSQSGSRCIDCIITQQPVFKITVIGRCYFQSSPVNTKLRNLIYSQCFSQRNILQRSCVHRNHTEHNLVQFIELLQEFLNTFGYDCNVQHGSVCISTFLQFHVPEGAQAGTVH